MTIASSVSKVSYTGNGSTTSFPIPFAFVRDQDVEVVLRAADGAESVLTLTTDYTLSGAGDATGGLCALHVPPQGESDVGTGDAQVLAIRRMPRIVQETDYQENDPFPAQSHEAALDLLTMICQSLDERLTRAVLMPLTDVGAPPAPGELLQAASTATTARDEALAAQTIAETARDAAAQSAAAASAVSGLPTIGTGDAGRVMGVNETGDGFALLDGTGDAYKAPVPVVSGSTTLFEGAAISLNIDDHVEGDLYEITANPLGLELTGAAFTGTAPSVDADTSSQLRLRRVRPDSGLLFSDECVVDLLVQNLPFIADPEGVAWANDGTDWPEADRANVAVGTGQLEPAGAVLNEFGVDGASTVNSLVLTHAQPGLLAEGDVLLLGDDVVFEVQAGVSQGTGTSDTQIHPGPGSGGLGPGYAEIASEVALPNSITISRLGMTCATAASGTTLVIMRHDGGNTFTTVASAPIDHTGSGYEYVSLASPYTIPATGTYHLGIHSSDSTLVLAGDQTGGVGRYLTGSFPAVGTSGEFTSTDTYAMHLAYTAGNYAYTVPCSPALAEVPASAHKLPTLSMATATQAGTIAAPDDFSALDIASVSRSGAEYTATCTPVSLPADTRRLAVGITGETGGGWSAYCAAEAQDAAQGDWTRATVAMIMGADFFKTANAATLMEE